MQNYLEKNKIYKVIPEDIDSVTKMELFDFDDNFLFFKNSEFQSSFKEDDKLELFTELNEGILYFKTNVIYYDNDILKLDMPLNFEVLQRRKNERIKLNNTITIQNEENSSSEVLLQDLSVGGMQILTDIQIWLNKKYPVRLKFDNIDLNLFFTPIRLSSLGDKFIASGILTAPNNSGKIELIQYCYNKKFEQENRK